MIDCAILVLVCKEEINSALKNALEDISAHYNYNHKVLTSNYKKTEKIKNSRYAAILISENYSQKHKIDIKDCIADYHSSSVVVAAEDIDNAIGRYISVGAENVIQLKRTEKDSIIKTLIVAVAKAEKSLLKSGLDGNVNPSGVAVSLDAVFKNDRVGIVITDRNSRIERVNEAWERMIGYSEEELKGMTTFDLSLPAERDNTRKRHLELADGILNSYSIEKFYVKKDGSLVFVEGYITAVRDSSGNVKHVIGLLIDKTDQKKAEELARKNKTKYETLLDRLPVGIYRTTVDGKILEYNKAMLELFDVKKPDELLNKNVEELYSEPDEREDILGKINDEEIAFPELCLKKADGKTLYVIDYPSPVLDENNNVIFYDGILLDITEQKMAQLELENYKNTLERMIRERTAELREVNEELQVEIAHRIKAENLAKEQYSFLQAVINSMPIPVYIKDAEKRYIDCNDAYAEIMGLSKSKIFGKKISDLQNEEISRRVNSKDDEIFKTGGTQVYEIKLNDSSGRELDVLIQKAIYNNADGKAAGLVGSITDITEIKEIQRALRESEERYRAVAESSIAGIGIADENENITYANEAFADMLGYTQEELTGMNQLKLVGPKGMKEYEKQTQRRKQGKANSYEMKMYRSDGEEIYTRLYASPLTNDKGEYLASMAIVFDITEQKKMEEELIKMQKLESLGLLAGGIAHDFNNILTSIVSNISLARIYTETESKAYNKLLEAEKAIGRAKILTGKLLTFSKGGAPVKRVEELAPVIEDNVEFLEQSLRSKCEVTIAEDLHNVEIDKDQISQVLYNLIINADQAMEEKGIITVTAENTELKAHNQYNLSKGEYVSVSVRDRGEGIEEKHASRVFDPYFTTKAEGIGLGLATVYSIINKHGGSVDLKSTPGEGSVFAFLLPAVDSEATKESKSIEKGHSRGRVLVMDDEEVILNTTEEVLEVLGYDVMLAVNGEEMLKVFSQAHADGQLIDIVIMDLTIRKGMGGKEAVRELLKIYPEAVCVASSGYSNDPVMKDYKKYGFTDRLEKPYKISDLNNLLLKLTRKEKRVKKQKNT